MTSVLFRRCKRAATACITATLVAAATITTAGVPAAGAAVLGSTDKATGTPVKVGFISDGKSDAIDNTPEIPPGPVDKHISVRIAYPGGAIVRQRNVRLGSEFAFKNTALRGQVLGPGGKPVAGAVITTSVNALTSTSRADGVWFLYFGLNQAAVANLTVTATTPAGASVTSAALPLQSEATVVVPTFQVP